MDSLGWILVEVISMIGIFIVSHLSGGFSGMY